MAGIPDTLKLIFGQPLTRIAEELHELRLLLGRQVRVLEADMASRGIVLEREGIEGSASAPAADAAVEVSYVNDREAYLLEVLAGELERTTGQPPTEEELMAELGRRRQTA